MDNLSMTPMTVNGSKFFTHYQVKKHDMSHRTLIRHHVARMRITTKIMLNDENWGSNYELAFITQRIISKIHNSFFQRVSHAVLRSVKSN